MERTHGSTDSVDAPVAPAPERMRDAFFEDIGRVTLGLVRGRRWALALGPVTLLRFDEPQAIAGGWRWPIAGGLLARRPGGFLSYTWQGGRLAGGVAAYEPLLPPLLYPLQLAVHHAVTRLFLLRLRGRAPLPGPPASHRERVLAAGVDSALGAIAGYALGRRWTWALAGAVLVRAGGWTAGGRSPGCALLGLRVVAVDGSRAGALQCAIRLIAGDRASGTVAVRR